MPITAAQLFYANVEAERSPSGRGGFQTLWADAGLRETDRNAIEARLLYRPGADAAPKGLFFALDARRLVVARIVALAGTDAFGRGGRYLAHALVCERAAWVAAGLDPCAVLGHAPFVTDLDQALAAGAGQARLPTLMLDPDPLRADPPSGPPWPPEVLGRLVLWALRAEARLAAREVLALVGSPAAVEAGLAAVFAALPAVLRPACGFDSDFEGGNLVATPWWAVGLRQAPAPGRYQRLDAEARCALDPLPPPEPQTPYERWVLERIETLAGTADPATGWRTLAAEREDAWRLARWLEGRLPTADLPAPESLAPGLFAAVCATAPELLRRQVRARLTDALPAALVELIWPVVEPDQTDAARYGSLHAGFAPAALADWIWTALGRAHLPPLSAATRQALLGWLALHPDPRIGLLRHCWAADWQALGAALAGLAPADYEQALPALLLAGAAPPPRLLLPGRGAALVSAWLPLRGPLPWSVPELVDALLRQRQASALSALVPLLSGLPPRERKALSVLVEAAPVAVPDDFAEALAQAGADDGLVARVKGWWR